MTGHLAPQYPMVDVGARFGALTALSQFRDQRGPSPKHTLDRVNNDGNYEPSNCRWATRSEQNSNTRRSRKAEVIDMTQACLDEVRG